MKYHRLEYMARGPIGHQTQQFTALHKSSDSGPEKYRFQRLVEGGHVHEDLCGMRGGRLLLTFVSTPLDPYATQCCGRPFSTHLCSIVTGHLLYQRSSNPALNEGLHWKLVRGLRNTHYVHKQLTGATLAVS